MKGSDLIALKIKKLGIKDVPVFQGGAIMNIIDSIGNMKGLNYYCPYHEQSLAMNIDGYSRIKGFGVGCVTSGPGATNLITGVCCAFYDSIPCLFFTGQVGQFHIKKNKLHRQRGFQETDVRELFSSITKFSYQIKSVDEIEYIIDKAVYIAKNGRPGPVVLDVPFNVQTAKVDLKKQKKFIPPHETINKPKFLQITKNIINQIHRAKKPVIIAGGGITISNLNKDFKKFIKKINVPFVTSWSSQDLTAFSDKLYFGSVGRHGNQSANEIIDNSDLVVSLGYRYTPKSIHENFGKKNKIKIISIDIDPIELNQTIVKITKKINMDLKIFFKILKKIKFKKLERNSWMKFCKKSKLEKFTNNLPDPSKKNLVNPYLFFDKFSDLTKKDSILITDAGANLCWCMLSYRIKSNQKLISAWGNSPMGYSIAAGIGACYANPNKQIISSIGDGSLMINLQDLQFLKHHSEVNLKIIIFDNETLGNTKLGTQDLFNGRVYANDRKNGYFPPDIYRLVKAFKIRYFHLDKDLDINKKVKQFLSTNKTAILHVKVSSEHNVIDHTKDHLQSVYKF
ncbi:thiamine pyrophosphate-binding protein [Candidatus Pelagibacter sp.]|nr:thiamine pyrophosphate-binding protein [Candidatus Pelagibacter sp.]